MPRRLTDDEASDFVSDWTRDGKAVIYESDISSKPKIFKQSINAEEREPLVVGPEAVDWARLSPDGARVLYTEIGAASTNGGTPVFRLMRVPANGGSPRLVLESRNPSFGSGLFNCGRAPAGVCLVREKSADHKILKLMAFDPYTGKQKQIRSIPMPTDVGLQGMMSPDGSIYAAVRMSQVDTRIHLFSLSGGPDHEVTVKGWPNIVSLDWSPDGKDSTAGRHHPKAPLSSLWICREHRTSYGATEKRMGLVALVYRRPTTDIWRS